MSNLSDAELDSLLAKLSPSRSPFRPGRLLSFALTLGTIAALAVLLLYGATQIGALQARAKLDAYDAHLRDRDLRAALDSLRASQAMLDEQRLVSVVDDPRSCRKLHRPADFQPMPGNPGDIPAEEAACLVDQVLLGAKTLSFGESTALGTEAATTGDPVLAAVRDLLALERNVAPTAGSARAVRAHPLYGGIANAAPPGVDPALWDRILAKRLAIVAAVELTDDDCAKIQHFAVDAAQAFDVVTWQGECLRKRGTTPDAVGQAREHFQRAVDALPAILAAQPSLAVSDPKDEVSLCSRVRAGARTLGATAARAYNGLAMTEVSLGDLHDASEHIAEAVCLRRLAMQTEAQVALSEENQAVIAFRKAEWLKARCTAEGALAANGQLTWSWTVLYLLRTGPPPVQAAVAAPCPQVDAADAEDRRVDLTRLSELDLHQRLTFFADGEFDRSELVKLLPPTEGFRELDLLLTNVSADHAALREGRTGTLAELVYEGFDALLALGTIAR